MYVLMVNMLSQGCSEKVFIALVFTVTRLSGDVLFSIVVSIQGCNSF